MYTKQTQFKSQFNNKKKNKNDGNQMVFNSHCLKG